MTASALSLAQTPLYEEKFVPALAMIATMRQNIENAIFSSLIFGIMHLTNLIWSPSLIISTICQVIYATFVGFLFCVIYYRSKNLISCMLLHGIFDFTAYFWFSFSDKLFQQTIDSNSVDISMGNGVLLILLSSTFVISGIFQLRKEFSK